MAEKKRVADDLKKNTADSKKKNETDPSPAQKSGNQLSFGTRGEEVAVLHRLLAALGVEIDESEADESRFGADTREAVRRFQILTGQNPTGEVDRPMAALLGGALERLQVTPITADVQEKVPPDAYYIEGTVTDPDGMPLEGATVVAEHRNLRDASEIGRAVTDKEGYYQIRSAARNDKTQTLVVDEKTGLPNLQVRVLARGGKPLYTSDIFYHVAKGTTIPIALGGASHRSPSDFTGIHTTLKPHLGTLKPEEFVENQNFRDISFLAGKTNLDKTRIAFYSVASRLACSTGLPSELFYGLFSQNIPPNASVVALATSSGGVDFDFNAQKLLDAILSTSDTALAEAVNAAIAKNVIPAGFQSKAKKALEDLAPLRTNAALSAPFGMGKTPIRDVLDAAGIPKDKQQKFITLYTAKTDPASTFWKNLGNNPDFTRDDVEKLSFSVDVGKFTKGHMPLVQKLMEMRRKRTINESRDLARLSAKDWKVLLNGTLKGEPIGIPANFTAETPEEAVDTFAYLLERNAERAFPTTAFSARLAEDKNSPIREKSILTEFLDTNPDFNLFTTNVDRYLKENPQAEGNADLGALRDALHQSKRLIKLASRYAAVKPLLADGIRSSQQIYAMGESHFVNKYAGDPNIGETEASTIYFKAAHTYGQALLLATDLSSIAHHINPIAIGNIDTAQLQEEVKDFPNLETLFGSFDFCAGDPGRTVLSPAAYLVDLLYFLSKRRANAGDGNSVYVKDILLKRRPDIAQIKLNAQNTSTVLPYIDLVNELLEEAVAPPSDCPNYPINTDAPTALQRQTTLNTEELNANPQYVNKYAYEILADAGTYFPWCLPFNLPLHEARTYLNQLGIDRVQLMHTFQKPPAIPSQQVIEIAVEGLGLFRAEADIITGMGPGNDSPWTHWGLNHSFNRIQNPADHKIWVTGSWIDILSNVRILLSRSGLTYQTLTQLLDTVFVNPAKAIQLWNEVPDSCSLDTMNLAGVTDDPDALDRLHRFVRLMRRLDWDAYTLDSALSLLHAGALNDADAGTAFLRQLYAVRTAMKRFRIPANVAIALFGNIETRDISNFPNAGDRRYSLYHDLFQNAAVLNPVDPIFALDDAGTEVRAASDNPPPRLIEHKTTLQGAFEISDADLTLAISSFTDGMLTLQNLSALYRHVVLSRGLGISMRELISLKALFETERISDQSYDPFDPSCPELLAEFCDAVDRIRSTPFTISDLDYLLRHRFDSATGTAPDNVVVGTLMKSILDGLKKIAEENTFSSDPTGAETRRRLSSVLDPVTLDSIMGILSGESSLSNTEQIKCITRLSGLLSPCMVGSTAKRKLVGKKALPPKQARYEFVLNCVLAYLRLTQGTGFVVQQLGNALALPVSTVKILAAEGFASQIDPEKMLLEDFLTLLYVERDPSMNNNPGPLSPEESGTDLISKKSVSFSTFFTHYTALDKAARIINGFDFKSDEMEWILSRGAEQGWLDPTTLPLTPQETAGGLFVRWSRLADAAMIKKSLPSVGTPFTSLMDLAGNDTEKAAYMSVLADCTQWPLDSLKVLCDDPLKSSYDTSDTGLLSLKYPDDYQSERALARLIPAFTVLRRSGISADVGGWIGPTITLDQANSIKKSVKAKYSSRQWLQIAKQLRDPLREQQRDALVAYLLVHPPEGAMPWRDANDVYSHFLIDVEMSACQGTSRIVQANAAVQLFVLRCILNLEPGVSVNANADSDWLQWQWMNRYRLWEANRKVFLFPENWIEPELRRDKSPFMEDLENDLLQNEVTADTAQNALLGYLEKLDGVARLQVVGMYDDSEVTPLPAIVDVIVHPAEVTILIGETRQFTATVFNAADKGVTWTASGGTVDANGLFVPPGNTGGTYRVTATSKEDKTKSSTAIVNVLPVSVMIDPARATCIVGGQLQLSATVSGAVDKRVTWTASGGTINQNGLFTAERAGNFLVTATSAADQGKYAQATGTIFGCRAPYSFSSKVEPVSSGWLITVYWGDENPDTMLYEVERRIFFYNVAESGWVLLKTIPPHLPVSGGTNTVDFWPRHMPAKIQYRVRACNHSGFSDYGGYLWVYL
jgi:hypothetical protein